MFVADDDNINDDDDGYGDGDDDGSCNEWCISLITTSEHWSL